MIQGEIKKVLGNNITFFNGAHNLAKHLKEILEKNEIEKNKKGNVNFIDSQNSKQKEERFYKILKGGKI